MTVVLDASAVLAYIQGEAGSDVVGGQLDGALIGAANWSEVLAKLPGGVEERLLEGIMSACGVTVVPVTKQDAALAARGRRHLSLGDRLCLALAERLDVPALTADRAWGDDGPARQIR